jgi:hypothetical protein
MIYEEKKHMKINETAKHAALLSSCNNTEYHFEIYP